MSTPSESNTMTTHAGTGANTTMTYAQALKDARALIVQQSSRIKSDAQKLKAQAEDVAQLRSTVEAMARELDRLRTLEPQLADAAAGREQAEALVGRQRVEIESLETASRELQRMLGEQAARINELTAEAEHLRSSLPTEEDAAALEQMAALLNNARSSARSRQQRPDEAPRMDRNAAHAMAREHHARLAAQARQREGAREMTIPADPTPFCFVNERRAA